MTRAELNAAARIVRETVSARDYAELIGLPVNRAGFTKCPFHSGDNSASMRLYPGERGWHCFGCHASGDVIELAKRLFGLRFPDAVERVAQDAGVNLPFNQKGKEAKAQATAAMERARNQQEIERLTAQIKEAVENKYWEIFDQWLQADKQVLDLELEERNHPEKGFSDDFANALMRRQELRLRLDWITEWRDRL